MFLGQTPSAGGEAARGFLHVSPRHGNNTVADGLHRETCTSQQLLGHGAQHWVLDTRGKKWSLFYSANVRGKCKTQGPSVWVLFTALMLNRLKLFCMSIQTKQNKTKSEAILVKHGLNIWTKIPQNAHHLRIEDLGCVQVLSPLECNEVSLFYDWKMDTSPYKKLQVILQKISLILFCFLLQRVT